MQLSEKDYQRIVVKIGSSLISAHQEKAGNSPEVNLIAQIASLIKAGKEVILVSSGAIALGMQELKLTKRPKDLAFLQAAAAIGQPLLMDIYQNLFRQHGISCAQLLLTWEDFKERRRYLNAKNTLLKILRLKALPIINENDTVSVDEVKFGDNDRLSALVASLVAADLLLILSDVDGLWDEHKRIIPVVDEITPAIRSLACPTDKQSSVGGMVTKIEAAKIAVNSGIPCLIANGRKKDILTCLDGTMFLPKKNLAAKARWMAFCCSPKGKVIVDDGARQALLNKKSLLAPGVVGVKGPFACGDIVSLIDSRGNEFARGKVCLSWRQLDQVKGKRINKEVMHCDNIVITD